MPRATDGSRWIFVLYLGLLVWVPVPLGSNRPWSWAVLELWVFVLALAWIAGYVRGRFRAGATLARARTVVWCSAGWLAYVWVQLLPLPLQVLRAISPEAARWHTLAALGGDIAFAPLSLDLYAGLDAACRSTAYVAFFVLSLVLLADRDRLRVAAYVLVGSGIFQALYGAFASFHAASGVATGTFVNRNHYAAYLVMCLSVGIGMLIASLSGGEARSWRDALRNTVEWVITPRMGLRLLLLVMVIALVLTRSRMGNAAFLAALLGAGTVGLVLSRRATRSTIVLLTSLILLDLCVIGAYFGVEKVAENIGQTRLQTEDRDEVSGYAVAMWKDFPVFGAGLGAFPAVFPRYSGEGTSFAYTHAHNDYLEFAAETGVTGLALLGLLVSLSLAAAVRAQHLRRDPVMRGATFGAMMGIIAILIHSAVEFNLQIPANAITFMLLLAFAWTGLCVDAEA